MKNKRSQHRAHVNRYVSAAAAAAAVSVAVDTVPYFRLWNPARRSLHGPPPPPPPPSVTCAGDRRRLRSLVDLPGDRRRDETIIHCGIHAVFLFHQPQRSENKTTTKEKKPHPFSIIYRFRKICNEKSPYT